MTRDEALAMRNRLIDDPLFRSKWSDPMNADHAAAVAQMDEVTRAIVGDPSNPQSLPAAGGRRSNSSGREIKP
jgi:hypothetical protein